MKKSKELRGFIESRPLEVTDVPTVKQNKYCLVYYPEFEGTIKVFWAQRFNDKIVLMNYHDKANTIDTVSPEKLKSLVFIDKESGKTMQVQYKQWNLVTMENVVDTNSLVKASLIKEDLVRPYSLHYLSVEDLLATIAKGFPSAATAKQIIANFGYKLEPIEH